MPNFGWQHYVPVLTWKGAEQNALQLTPAAVKEQMTPLLEIVPIPVNSRTGAFTKSLHAHVDRSMDKIRTSWSPTADFFLDPAEVAQNVTATGVDGASFVFQRASAGALAFVPVTGLQRTPVEIRAALAHSQRGLCLRLLSDDLARQNLPHEIGRFLVEHKLDVSAIDLIIDFESVEEWQLFTIIATAEAQLARLPSITAWRTVTLAGCSFPRSLGGIQGLILRPRLEWQGWLALHAKRATLSRLPTFGDYAIQSPELIEGYDAGIMGMTPAIRYAADSNWLIVRGQSSKRQRLAPQYPVLAGQLVASPHFYGAAHCSGCTDAAACAAGQPRFGAPAGWRRIGTAHHLVVATSQIAGLPAP